MTKRTARCTEEAHRQVLDQLYTLAFYAFGDGAAAQNALESMLRACGAKLNHMSSGEFLLYGMRYFFQEGRAAPSPPNGVRGGPDVGHIEQALLTLDFEERLTLLLYARHGMTPNAISRLTGRKPNAVRLTVSLALRRLSSACSLRT